MSDLIFTGTTEEGERVDITLSSLMQAKWNWPGTAIRTASTIGDVNVLADSIQSADYDALKAEVARWNAIEIERGNLLYRTLGHRDLVNFIARFKELTDDLATMTADRDSEQRWAQTYHDRSDQLESERDALKAENERLIELVTTQSDNLKISASNVQEMNTTIFNQFKEIQKLRAALAHFAERSNWRTSGLAYDWTGGTLPYKTPWNIAREALGVTK